MRFRIQIYQLKNSSLTEAKVENGILVGECELIIDDMLKKKKEGLVK